MNDLRTRMTFPSIDWQWNAAQVRAYGLAIGAPWSTLDENDLSLVTGPSPTPFPTIAVLLADEHSLRYHPLPGVQYDPLDVIYAGHELELLGPLAPDARGTTTARLVNVGDVSAGVLAVRECTSTDDSDRVIARNVVTSIIRGASIGSPAERPAAPVEGPLDLDEEIEIPTLPQQALLYAQTGDDNPLHLSPSAARAGGFDRPILHGLCSYAMVAHGVMRSRADGRWSDLRRISARFTAPVVPGETLLVRTGRRESSIEFTAWVRDEHGGERMVLSHGQIQLAGEASLS